MEVVEGDEPTVTDAEAVSEGLPESEAVDEVEGVVPSESVTSCDRARPNNLVSRYARLFAVSGPT